MQQLLLCKPILREGYLVSIGEIQLQISHPRKKSFMKALNDYVGGCSA